MMGLLTGTLWLSGPVVGGLTAGPSAHIRSRHSGTVGEQFVEEPFGVAVADRTACVLR